MFTVKHIQHGIENLYSAQGVTHRIGEGVEMLMGDGRHKIFDGTPRGPGCCSSGDQEIYVMNENGKTVAKYDLNPGAPAPVGIVGRQIG